jgi:hypothetical protein
MHARSQLCKQVSPAVRTQAIARRSNPPEMITALSRENLQLRTAARCPFSTCTSLPVFTAQMRSVWSCNAESKNYVLLMCC